MLVLVDVVVQGTPAPRMLASICATARSHSDVFSATKALKQSKSVPEASLPITLAARLHVSNPAALATKVCSAVRMHVR